MNEIKLNVSQSRGYENANLELIKVTTNEQGQKLVSGRELHEVLEIGTRFNDWIKRMVGYGFVEGTDFTTISKKRLTNNPKNPYTEETDCILTLEMAKDICRKQRRNAMAAKILKYLLMLENKEVYVVEPNRKEIEFAHMLETITGFEWQKQVSVCDGKYRIDFLLGQVLIVEYDEKYHETEDQKQKDSERIEEIREWFKEEVFLDDWDIPVIRIEEGFEYQGVKKIIDHLVGYEYLSSWNNEAKREQLDNLKK